MKLKSKHSARPELSRLTAEQRQIKVPGKHGLEVISHVLETARANFACHALMIQPLRAMAKRLGYALALHGTMARDLDILAAPWEEWAVEPQILAECLRVVIAGFNPHGFAEFSPKNPTPKPHGRMAWSIVRTGAGYIDLSVMPPLKIAEACPLVHASAAPAQEATQP